MPGTGPWGTIVVGTDGSDTAARAVDHAAQLAAAAGAGLVVVTAYQRATPQPGEGVPSDLSWAATASAGAEDVARAAADAASRAGAASVRTRTQQGDPVAVLQEVAGDVGADLIVVGSRGMSSPTRFVTGSVPNSLSHRASCDVLIVRTD